MTDSLQGRTQQQRADSIDAAGYGCLGIIITCLIGGVLWSLIGLAAWCAI